ncbi:MAG: hypothetical protein Q6M04_05985 [Thermostichus sp. BF3_bins_97]
MSADLPSEPTPAPKEPENQPIGQVLKQAGLLNEGQIQVALVDQRYSGLLFGEILVARGWVKPETITFFLDHLILPRDSEVPRTIPQAEFRPAPTPVPEETPHPQPPTPAAEDLSRYITRSERIPSAPKRPTQPPVSIPAERRTHWPNPFRRTMPPTQASKGKPLGSKPKETYSSALRVEGYRVEDEGDALEQLLEEDGDLRELLE